MRIWRNFVHSYPHNFNYLLKRIIFFIGLALWLSLVTKGRIITDEGDHLYYSWRIIRGDVFYRDFFDQHAPLAYFIVSGFFLLFGPSLWVAKLVMICTNLLIAYFMYRISTRFTSDPMAHVSALLFCLIGPCLYSMKFLLEPFVLLFTAASLLLFYRYYETNQHQYLILAGITTGFAFLSKQNSFLFFLIFLGIFLFQKRDTMSLFNHIKTSMFFAGGTILSILPLGIYILINGALNDAINDVFLYNLSSYQISASRLPPTSISLETTVIYAVVSICFVPLAGIGLKARYLFGTKFFQFLIIWEGSMLFIVYPRFGISHFIAAIAPAIIMGTIFLNQFQLKWREAFSTRFREDKTNVQITKRNLYLILILILIYSGLFAGACSLYLRPELSHDLTYESDLNEIVVYIQEVTLPDEKIFILGIHPELYFLSQRKASGGYPVILPWHLVPETQEMIIDCIKNDNVKLILFEDTSEDGLYIRDYAWIIYEFIIHNYTKTRMFSNGLILYQ